MMWFKPRDIGVNRYPFYINGIWSHDAVYSGFEFEDIEDLKMKLQQKYPSWNGNNSLLDILIIEGDKVKSWTVVGYIENIDYKNH